MPIEICKKIVYNVRMCARTKNILFDSYLLILFHYPTLFWCGGSARQAIRDFCCLLKKKIFFWAMFVRLETV